MANFRRRRPRASGNYKGYSETGWRSRHGLKPIKVPQWPGKRTIRVLRSIEYMRFHEWRSRVCYPSSAPRQMNNWPRWFDLVFHTRPQRRRATQMMRAVKLGKIDSDAANWPLAKKPLVYYW